MTGGTARPDDGDREGCAATAGEVLRRAAADGRVPSIVAAVRRPDGTAWVGGVGHRDGRDGPTPSMATQYRVGSITKSLTAALVLAAADAGRLALDEPVSAHLDDVEEVLGEVRLAELLGHVSGVRAETRAPWWERSEGRTWEELLPDLANEVVRPAPRGVLHYSNVGYAVLGRVLEVVEGRSWAELLQERLLDPLGMSRTSTVALDDDHATPLAVHPERDELVVEPVFDHRVLAPAGQLWSTVDDLLRWAGALCGERPDVLDDTTVERMARPRAVTTLDPPSAFGLGLQVRVLARRTVVGHGGSVPGFVAGLVVDPVDAVAVVVLANSTAGFPSSLGADLLATVLGPPDDASVPDGVTVPDGTTAGGPAGSEQLVGTWYWGPRPVAVRGEDGDLVVDLGLATRRSRLDPHDGGWVARDGYFTGERLDVVRRSDGTVSHLELASFALTPGPYEPADAVPGGIGDGWRPPSP